MDRLNVIFEYCKDQRDKNNSRIYFAWVISIIFFVCSCCSVAHSKEGNDQIEHNHEYLPKKPFVSLYKLPHYIQVAKSIIQESSPDLIDKVDQKSLRNIARALQNVSINSLEEAQSLHLQLVPPGPVFHVWLAMHGTTLFNGENNPPALKGLNYVKSIEDEASQLAHYGLPLFLVYSEINMSEEQINEMNNLFVEHPNIIVLSLETELMNVLSSSPPALKCSVTEKQCGYESDDLRGYILKDYTDVYPVLLEKARAQGKTEALQNFEGTEGRSVTYSDIDNHWMSRPPYILAPFGIVLFPRFSRMYTYFHLKDYDLEKLNLKEYEQVTTFQKIFSDYPYLAIKGQKKRQWNQKKADIAYNFIISGNASHESHQINGFLKEKGIKIFPEISEYPWDTDNGFVSITTKPRNLYRSLLGESFFASMYYDRRGIIRLRGSSLSQKELNKISTLSGLQMWRYLHAGKDGSWHIE